MGLMFLFPHDEKDSHCLVQKDSVRVVTYGLPGFFWWYLIFGLTLHAALVMASIPLWKKLILSNELIDQVITYGSLGLAIVIPLVFISFFFYRKSIWKKDRDLILNYSLFGLPFWKKKIYLKGPKELSIQHYMDSPNMARLHDHPDFKSFQNKGYFELYAVDHHNKQILIDRCSQKRELDKLRELLFRF